MALRMYLMQADVMARSPLDTCCHQGHALTRKLPDQDSAHSMVHFDTYTLRKKKKRKEKAQHSLTCTKASLLVLIFTYFSSSLLSQSLSTPLQRLRPTFQRRISINISTSLQDNNLRLAKPQTSSASLFYSFIKYLSN